MKRAITLILVLAVFAACSQNSRREKADASKARKASVTLTVPTELTEIYKELIFEVTRRETDNLSEVRVGFNTPVRIDGTPFTVTVFQFFPDFVMSEAGYSSRSLEPNNLAARVLVTTEGSPAEYTGWLFASYPDMHPIEHPQYKVILKGVVKR